MKLFVIGNGFDIAHSIPCKYSDFHNYLIENRQDVLNTMKEFYSVESSSELWSDFERSLEKDIDWAPLSEIIWENAPNFTSDDFRDRDYYDAQLNVERKCKKLLVDIHSGFEEWIKSLEICKICKKYELDMSAKFLSFNYTETLEQIYKIPASNILHIHNRIGEKLIFGHGKSSNDFNIKKELYGDENAFSTYDKDGNLESNKMGHEQYAEWFVCDFYEEMRKKTEEIIGTHLSFFLTLSDIDKIIVIGHSYNDIDLPYFKKIAESVKKNTQWTLCYHSEKDKECAEKVMENLKVDKQLFHFQNSNSIQIQSTQLKLF